MTSSLLRLNGKQRAFTLLEVMIVVGIMAIVMAISMPALRYAGEQEPLDMAVEMITDLTGKARADAIMDRRKQLVVINLESAEKGLAIFGLPEVQRQLAGDGQLVEIHMEPQMLATNRFPDSVSLTPVEPYPKVMEIWFRPDGTCDGAEITLSEGGRVYQLFLERSTSLAEITEE
ncbi:MAG: prepilin-type N-terminal cleavage/methylation domain-containing protein [Verrucomicrobiota bacterium]|jgi:prepilin-type N-terminal cleavage/methylation domain-containing protein|nr:prepilin-type N-terminal cleavage/methylation domain-containing protein [Verrucomicrobiota bacterium]